MKILFIAPHLSTGGLPQYLFKKIENLCGDNDVYCVEYSNHSNSFIVQRDKIKNILKEKYFLLGDDKSELLRIIEKINPEIVHLEEIPEYFLEREIADRIYKPDREYKIFETSHDSSFDTNQKVYLPDKMMLVSRYQVDNFSKLEIPCVLMEYPIEYAEPFDKKLSQKLLGLDPNKKHVINVGLFTPRKNQAEIVEYAKRLLDYPIQFHFIGNQADNFQNYWQPIMKDFPPNCKWWGERSDVSKFYKAADLFLFTSRGTNSDKETSPLVIREAISYRVPSLIYNLPVYMGMYDNYPNIKYLEFDNFNFNIDLILSSFGLKDYSFGRSFHTLNGLKRLSENNYPNSMDESIKKYGDEAGQYWATFLYKELDKNGINVDSGDVFVDLGANIGISSTYALKCGASEVHCFEPDPIIRDILIKNIPNAKLYPYAINSIQHQSKLNLYHWPGNEVIGGTKYECESIRFKDALKLVGKPIDYLKIDIEGFEDDIFDDLNFNDCKLINKIFIEHHHRGNINQLVEKLKSLGFYTVVQQGFWQSYIYAKRIDQKMKNLFSNIKFSPEENKIIFNVSRNIPDSKVVVRDATSNLTIYWTSINLSPGINYWIIPIGEIHFSKESSFRGFLIEVYDKNDEMVDSTELIINENASVIDDFKFISNPFDRNWYNYYEFFYRNKYKGDFDISENDVVVDIGANCGTLTRYCVSKNARKVYSIEADPKAFKNLQKSFKDFKNVIPIHCLVDKASGESQFYSCKSNTTISSKINAQVDMFYKNEDYEVTNIKSLSLNDLISQNNIRNVDYFKMDIEGAEYDSMSTLDWNFFAKHVKKFILEFHHYQKFKNEFENIKSKLLENGFDIVKINHVTKDIAFDYEKDEMGVLYAVNSKIKRPVIKCVHLLSRTDDEREIRSVASVSELAKLGFRYTQNINKPHSSLPPKENCARPNDIAMEPGKMKLSPGHYGCYLAHSTAILSEFDPEKHDAILIFECDAIAKESIKSLEKEILMAYDLCENQGLLMYSFGCNYDPNAIDKGDYLEASSFYEAHAYLITKSNYKLICEKIKSTKWDVFDLWIANNLKGFKFGVSKKPYVLQAKGYSLLDKKISEKNFLNVEKL